MNKLKFSILLVWLLNVNISVIIYLQGIIAMLVLTGDK